MFKKNSKTNLQEIPTFNSVQQALESGVCVPFKVRGKVERTGVYAASNYSGLAILLENDAMPCLLYDAGGVGSYACLTKEGDTVLLLFKSNNIRDKCHQISSCINISLERRVNTEIEFSSIPTGRDWFSNAELTED